MKTKAQLFFQSLKGKKVAFVGLGVSHIETIQLFAREGIATFGLDRRKKEEFNPELLDAFEQLGVTIFFETDHILETDPPMDIVFRTPGMYYHTPALAEFHRCGGVVTSEMEVFFDLCPCPIIAVTGSDGKTTSSTLISEMLKEEGFTVHLGGNIGRALLPLIHDIQETHLAVVELSSFQLLSMRPAPAISLLTNITPNHLDVHKDFSEYIDAKKQIFLHQNAFSRTVLGIDNVTTAHFPPLVRGELSAFSLREEVPIFHGAYLKEDVLTLVQHGTELPLFHKDKIRLPGVHNVANYLGAIAATSGMVSPASMEKVATTFGGVEHRIEFVRELDGVSWYNDSIASSPTRSIAGIRSFPEKRLILIAGGYDKNIPYDPLAEEIVRHVDVLITMGATGPAIQKVVRSHPEYQQHPPHILEVSTMEEAVKQARQWSTPGDVVLLSPASASFDLYKNFEHRGHHFKKLVHHLDQ